ncbi:MAG: aminotransferase class IV [Solobacterium sp.]|nr:aminotransferase class IV [Solobacterium sp.]MDO4192662.1 aminotransferase class IV [Erysipelotrichaceae bacterium]
MKEIGYYNGEMGLLNEVKIPMQDRALYFGDGVYDVTFAYNHHLFAMNDHLDRFYNSCRMLEIDFPLTREELTAEIQKCVDAAETDGAVVIYWQSSRSNSKRNHVYPDPSNKPTLLITITEAKAMDYSIPMKLITWEDTRFFHCNIKTLNLIPNVVASQRAKEAGCGEAVLHRGNQLTECAHSSLLLLKDGVLIGPKLNELILPSISRKHLFEIAEELGVPTQMRDVTMDEVWNADEVIVCSTTKVTAAADTLDGKPVGMKDRELFLKLQKAYFDRVEKEIGWKLG